MGKIQKFQFKSKKKEAKFFVFSSMAALLAACEFEATENADDINLGEVDKAGILDALAGNDKVTGSQYGDLIRGNKGADVIKSGQGEDHLVVVGLSKDGKYSLTDITNANGTNNDLSGVVSLAEINNNSTSEIVKGDVMDGGNDGAIIFIFGDVDLSVAKLLNIKKIELQGDLKFGAEQLDALAANGEFKGINGDKNSTLTIEADGKKVEVDLTKMDLSNIKTLVLKGDVTLLVDQEDLKDIKSIEGEGTLKGAAGNLDFNGISLGQDIKVEAAGDLKIVSTGGVEAFSQGEKLLYTGEIADIDGTEGVQFTHSWIRSDNADGTGNVTNLGSTKEYDITNADVGKYISLQTTYTDNKGNNETIITKNGKLITNINDAPTSGTLTIVSSGGANFNERDVLSLTGEISDADGTNGVTFTHVWIKSDNADGTGNVVELGTNPTYTLTQADVGKYISVKTSYTDNGTTQEEIVTPSNKQVANVNDNPLSTIMVTSTGGADAFKQGQTLSFNGDITDLDGLNGVTISHKWIRSDNSDGTGNVVDLSTDPTYVLTQADVGKYVSLVSEYTDEQGTAETVISRSGTATINVNDAPVGALSHSSSGAPNFAYKVGQTLTVNDTITDADGISSGKTYHWYRSDDSGRTNNIEKIGTGTTYVLQETDQYKYISVRVAYEDDEQTKENVLELSNQSIGDQFISFTTGVTNEALTGTDGDDIFRADTLSNQAGESADGGLGIDTLQLVGTLGGVMPNFSNIEKIHLLAPDANSTEDFRGNADITHVKIEDSLTGDFTLQVQDDVSVSVEKPSGSGTLNIEYTGGATQVEIDLSDMNRTTNLDVRDLDGNSIQTVILNTSNSGSNLQNVSGTDLAANATLQITGDQDLAINGNVTGFATINASAHTGKLTITHDNIIAGSGADKLNGTIGIDVINAGDGDNEVNAGAGADEITLGTGNNTIIIEDDDTATVVNPGVNSISTVGMDIITGANAGDIIQQGTGTSLLFGGKAVHTVQEAFIGDTSVIVRGNYDQATNTFVGDANGSDSMIIRDENQDNNILDANGYILVGFAGSISRGVDDNILILTDDADFYMTGNGHNGSTGIDNYVGTAGNDLIIGDNLTAWGPPSGGSSPADTIDGAGGEDTILFSGHMFNQLPTLSNVEHIRVFKAAHTFTDVVDYSGAGFADVETISLESRHGQYLQKHNDDVHIYIKEDTSLSRERTTSLEYDGAAQNIDLTIEGLNHRTDTPNAKIEIHDGSGDSITNLNLNSDGSSANTLNILDVSNANLLDQLTIGGGQSLRIDKKLDDQITTIDASASTGGVGVVLGDGGVTFTGGSGGDGVTGGTGADTLIGGAGEDVLIGGTGVDTFQFKSGDSALSLTGSGNAGKLLGFDEIRDYNFDGANSDIYEIEGQNSIAADATDVDGVNSALTIHGESIDSHSISNGMLSVKLEFSTTNEAIQGDDVDAIVQYLQLQDLGDAGTSVAFNAGADAYVFTQGDDLGTNAQDILTKFTNIQLNALEDVNSQTANTLFIA